MGFDDHGPAPGSAAGGSARRARIVGLDGRRGVSAGARLAACAQVRLETRKQAHRRRPPAPAGPRPPLAPASLSPLVRDTAAGDSPRRGRAAQDLSVPPRRRLSSPRGHRAPPARAVLFQGLLSTAFPGGCAFPRAFKRSVSRWLCFSKGF